MSSSKSLKHFIIKHKLYRYKDTLNQNCQSALVLAGHTWETVFTLIMNFKCLMFLVLIQGLF